MADTIISTQKIITCLASGAAVRCKNNNINNNASKVDQFPSTHRLRFSSVAKQSRFSFLDQKKNEGTRKKKLAICALPPETPVPIDVTSHGQLWDFITNSSLSDWQVWVGGSAVTVLLSFATKGKWGPLLQLQDKLQTTIDQAEKVVDMVEDVAERVEKVAEEAANNLPEGKLQDAAEYIENLAEKIDKSAEMAEAALEKIEDISEQLESFVESTQELKTVTTTVQAKDQN
ncbi:uncharacterized protein LOC130966663 [Arachis stenosperma]|uniref:uncharacterized protein LOC130966663 n=1 Tax=Arachis stenosperma TaxID=217475 RepID=UPI0025AD4858|nr:uncharacterized protein LOC130966663 [Arachis stenosperma]